MNLKAYDDVEFGHLHHAVTTGLQNSTDAARRDRLIDLLAEMDEELDLRTTPE